MENFNPLQLPPLDAATVLPQYQTRFTKFAHIEYMKGKEGQLLRICRPFGNWPIFYVPITSLLAEYQKDMELINNNILVQFPKMYDYDCPDDERDSEFSNGQNPGFFTDQL